MARGAGTRVVGGSLSEAPFRPGVAATNPTVAVTTPTVRRDADGGRGATAATRPCVRAGAVAVGSRLGAGRGGHRELFAAIISPFALVFALPARRSRRQALAGQSARGG
jgi:hypothetical protein